MKNWKRFIAACLSVTMVASIPLTAFAESSVSVKELAPKASSESETQEETDLEKILSQEKPYEYFSSLKDQEKLLDACKDEELFQLKEYMKYAYIHESDLKNRQSLDAYLTISEAWKSRNVTFDKDEQEKLLQLPEKAKVYGTKFEGKYEDGKSVEKTVKDFSTYMEYLQSIKKFDVPRYIEILSAFDEAKTEENLAKAKEAYSNFEEETFGFDEQEAEPKKEDSKVDEQPAKEDKKEDYKAEQSAEKEESKSADTSKKNTESAKSATKIVEFADVRENGHQPLQCHIISEKEKDTMSELLPKTVKAKMENGDIVDIDVTWKVDEDPKTTNNTVYTYDIQLPEKYSISDQLQALMDMEQSRLPFIYIKIKEELEKEGHQRPFVREPIRASAPIRKGRSGTNANGFEFDYEIYDITNDGSKIVIKGWAYTPDRNQYGKYQGQAGNSIAATKDYVLNQHPEHQWGGYYLEVKNTSGGVVGSYPLTVTERVDHTDLWKGDSRNPTLIDVSFRFDIPLSDLVNKGDLYLNLHYIHPRVGDASFYLMYLAPSTSMTSGSYRVDFKADNISSFRTTGIQSFVNKDPWKGNSGVWYNGNRLYYSTNDYFYLSNGTWYNGQRSLDSYKTTWFYTRLRYTGVTQSDGWMHRTKADAGGSIYGWIPSTFIQYNCSNFRLNVSYNTFTNSIAHWASGFRNGEGQNGSKDSMLLGNTSFSANVGSSYVMDSSKATRIPNGYRLNTTFGTSAISGSWGSYSIGTRVTQKSYGMGYEYYYVPNTYSITYNLNGGTNNSSNPSSYNVLYGVALKNPTKTGYTFAGWYEGNTRVYGINQGANASFSNGTDMYNKLAGRKTGNVTLTAKWTPNTYTNSISHWLYGFKNEGTNGDKHAFQIGSTSFSSINGNTFTLGANNAVTPPHGCFVENYIGTSSVTGNWTDYKFGQSFTQKPTSMGFQYNYSPYQYNINYNLDGGTNNSSNPSSYNVLYGLTLKTPTKTGYKFLGWEEDLFRAKDATIYNGASRNGETFTFTNGTSGNTFTASKVQVWTNDWSRYIAQPVYAGVGTHNNIVGTYTHTEPTGNYMINVAANGTTQDYNAPLKNVYLEKGKTYTFTIGSSTASSNKVTIGNVSIKGDITGINAGKSVPNPVTTDFINNELPTRKIGDVKLTATWERTPYLDVNAVINGTEYYSVPEGYSTFDVYINGKLDANDVNDYWTMCPLGTKYEIKDIKPASNVKYLGATKGTSVSGTITETGGNISVWLKFVTTQTNTLHHKYWGLANKEGNSSDGEAFLSRTDTFKQDFGTEFTLGKDRKDPNMPNGFELNSEYYSQSDSKKFPVGTTVTQKDEDMVFYYDYLPIDYKITYDLGGETNNAANPSTYDVLYGVSLKAPTRPGYKFTGWYQGDTKITGINEGKNADFVKGLTDPQKFYDELEKRTTGDITLTAKWTPNKLTIRYHLNGGTDIASDTVFTSGDPAAVDVFSYPTVDKTYGLKDITTARVTPPTGYLIKGTWNTKADGSGKSYDFTTIYKLADFTPSIETGNAAVDLYAQWTPKKLVTTFHKNDGSTTTATQTFTYDVAGQKFSDKKWTRTGYTLLGWADSKTATKAQYAILSGVSNAWVEKHYPKNDVYAVWKANSYTITYEGNGATGGSTPSSNRTYDKPQTLTPNGFHKDGYYFDSWNTKPDGTGTSYKDKEEVKNLTSKDGDTVTLYAQWKPVDYKITCKGNGSTGGTEKTHLYNQKDVEANGYAVRTNKGYTDFVRTNHTFMGWYQNSVVDTKAEMAKIYKQGSKLTYSQLLAIHAEQVKKGLVKETDPKVKDILLYAVWDEAPSIDTSGMKKAQFYEGVDVTRAELLNGITASDKIDGSLTSQIIITRIDYSAGKLVNGKKQAAYSQTWANGMPADAKLDTWFMQLDKNDSPVTHTITYQVKDSAGNITTAKETIQVVYNEFPTIKANDFKFTLDDAQAGLVTKDKLLEKAVASGVVSASDMEDGDMKSKIELIDYDANAFKTMKQEGFIPITYRVQDSMGPGGKGKVTLKTVNVNIYLVRKEETVRYVRFINKEYYEKNANLDRNALAGKYDQIALLSVNGGLHPFSVWYTDPTYRALITETFEKTKGTTYVYTKDDIKKMREFVKQHGVGNAKEEDALSKFADIFMTGDYILK